MSASEHFWEEQPEAESTPADRERRRQSHLEWVQEAQSTFSQMAEVRVCTEAPADAHTGARGA